MAEGGEFFLKTRFKATPHPGWVEIVFIDNGPGIKKENMDKLFSPFFTTKLRGTGLGMAICQRIIVERHRGKIRVASEEGKGTTVTVELPASLPQGVPGVK
jgi:signal transduction histidine kinase